MKKIILFIMVIGITLISVPSFGDEIVASGVINAQTQHQMSGDLTMGAESMSVGFQSQEQLGAGMADTNSIAGDGQIQNGTMNGSSLTAVGGGVANGGSYQYMNKQGAITMQTTTMDGAVGGMGAITRSTGNAVSIAGGELVNGTWSMSNGANSITKPVSINIDGYLNY